MAKTQVVSVALVTGGARGIGRSIAATLAARGMGVMVADLLDTSECVEQIRASGGKAMGVCADMADPGAAKEAVLETVRPSVASMFSSTTPGCIPKVADGRH